MSRTACAERGDAVGRPLIPGASSGCIVAGIASWPVAVVVRRRLARSGASGIKSTSACAFRRIQRRVCTSVPIRVFAVAVDPAQCRQMCLKPARGRRPVRRRVPAIERDGRQALAARDRSWRDQDRNRRARRRRAASFCGGGSRRRTATIARRSRRSRTSCATPSASSARRGTVGIGTPGLDLARDGPAARLAIRSASTASRSRRDLEAALGREVRITNDANCFALSEATDGAGAGRRRRLRRHPRHRRRRGHRRARPRARRPERASPASGATTRCPGPATTSVPGHACFCGQSGCIETWLSGPGIERDHLRGDGRAGAARRTSRRARRAATPRARRPSRATRSGSPGRSRT